MHTYEVSVTASEESVLSIGGNGIERCKMEFDTGKTYLSLSWEAESRTVLGHITGYRD